MGEVSGISWTDATFNPWIGCTRDLAGLRPLLRGPRQRAARMGSQDGATGVPRRRTKTWREPLQMEPQGHAVDGIPHHACSVASLADIFDNDPCIDPTWRD
jgi:protein gp37